jgi:hypothetical protein
MLLFFVDVEAVAPLMIVKKDGSCGLLCGTEDVVDRAFGLWLELFLALLKKCDQ